MRRLRYFLSVLPLLVLTWGSASFAQPLSVDFRQAANNDKVLSLGNVQWTNGALQRNNSAYYEGMSVPQRIMLMNIKSTPGNQHTLTFEHAAAKNGVHAYDFLTSYDQAVDAADAIAGPGVLVNLNACGGQMGPPATMQATCATLRTNGFSALVPVPDGMGTLLGRSIAARITSYETRFGNRTIRIYGNAPITSAALVFTGYTSGNSPVAQYTLSWSSSSTTVLVEMAAHLALGVDAPNAGTGIGYGSGLGAGSISGAPFHVKLARLDGTSLGSRDNQILSSVVRTNILCSATGPNPVCSGTQNIYSFLGTQNSTVTWSLSSNSNNASILGAPSGSSVIVQAGRGGGGYVVNATASDGVQTVTCAVPVQINAPSVTLSATPIVCGGSQSTITVTATGGTPPYTGTGTFQRGSGNHDFTVVDANNCTTTASITINAPLPLTASASAAAAPCGGTTNVTVTASGGTPPYSGTGSFQRAPGTYSFTVTDANNCSAISQVTVAATSTLAATAVTTGSSCNGSATVLVSASGGTPPYTGTGSFQRTAGTYSFTVTDANNCSAVTSLTVTTPPALTVGATSTPLSCGNGTSTIDITAAGGTPPYTGTGMFLRGTGTYTFTVTDAGNCSASTTVTITGPPVLTATATAAPLACNATTATTTVTVGASGGTAPYSGTGTFTRGAGTHTFTVTDANNCSTQVSVTITAPASFTATASAAALGCNGGTTTVDVSASGGTPPYTGVGRFIRGAGTFTFTVTDANNCSAIASVTITAPAAISVTSNATPILCNGSTSSVTISATGGTPPYTGTGTFTRSAGTHTFTITDANTCSATTTVTITQPAAPTASATATPIYCGGTNSSITVSATGGVPPYSGTGTFSRGAGTHTFTITDANNCSATTTVTVTSPPVLVATSTAPQLSCNSSTATVPVTVAATGGTPPYTGTGVFALGAGAYLFTVTDANNCSATTTISITAPPTLVATSTATTISCNGGTATVTVGATGGTPPYTGTGSFTRSAGTYTFTVTDVNSCSATTSVTITAPPALSASASGPSLLCSSNTTPITVAATGGTAPYTGTGIFPRGAGTHTFTVTDANNCTAVATVTITAPSTLSANATFTPIACNGDMSTVTVTASGGTPPYTGTGAMSRGAGTHTFTVTDANSCSAQVTITITQPAALSALATATPIACHGGTSQIVVTAQGGTGAYTGTGTFTRGAGIHTFTVTDGSNCSAQVTVNVVEPNRLIASSTATPLVCNGGLSTINVTATGGTPPYAGTGQFSRGAGIYTFTITDANNCSSQTTVSISEPPALIAYATSTPIDCNGGTSTITVTGAGGTPPYAGLGTFTRGAGTYSFTITDVNNCSAQVSITVTEPPALVVVANATAIACNGGSSSVTVTAAGGTPPYAGAGSFVRGAGMYTFTITDSKGCSASASLTITQPDPLVATANATPILCAGGMSTVTVTAAGGTLPYSGTGVFQRGPGIHSFTVVDANSCTTHVTITIVEPSPVIAYATSTPILCAGDMSTVTVTAAGGTQPYTGIGTFSRPAGTHTFTVTDVNGCFGVVTITITEPPALVAVVTFTPIACNGGTSTVTITGAGGTPPYTGTGLVTRSAGTHSFTVTDANGCTATRTITINQPTPLVATASATPILCNGEMSVVTITAAGGTAPYTGTGLHLRGAGTYSFTVTDVYGCRTTVSITVTQPAPLVAAASGPPLTCGNDRSPINVTATGGTQPYSGTGIFPRQPGTYSFIVTDANGCKSTATITIAGPPPLVAAISSTPILCNGGNSTITVSASGGTPPYTGTGTFNRMAGFHRFIIEDANHCLDTVTMNITEPDPLVVTCNITPTCINGYRTVSVDAMGGTPPYSYLWSPGNVTTQSMIVPCTLSGRVTVIVRDANWNPNDPNNSSCEATCQVILGLFAPEDSSASAGASAVRMADAVPTSGLTGASSDQSLQRDPADGSFTSAERVTAQRTETPVASESTLLENYPNPFNPTTTIRYILPEESRVHLSILNTLGETVTVLVDAVRPAGTHAVPWDATDALGIQLPTGRYITRIHAVSLGSPRIFTGERLMLLLK